MKTEIPDRYKKKTGGIQQRWATYQTILETGWEWINFHKANDTKKNTAPPPHPPPKEGNRFKYAMAATFWRWWSHTGKIMEAVGGNKILISIWNTFGKYQCIVLPVAFGMSCEFFTDCSSLFYIWYSFSKNIEVKMENSFFLREKMSHQTNQIWIMQNRPSQKKLEPRAKPGGSRMVSFCPNRDGGGKRDRAHGPGGHTRRRRRILGRRQGRSPGGCTRPWTRPTAPPLAGPATQKGIRLPWDWLGEKSGLGGIWLHHVILQ